LLPFERVDEVVEHWPSAARAARAASAGPNGPTQPRRSATRSASCCRSRSGSASTACTGCAAQPAPPRHEAELPAGGTRTLRGALTERTAVFRIAPDRHEREARALLGAEFAGVACSDRWSAYNHLDPEQRQVCWSHLTRDFSAQSEGLEPEQRFGQAGLEIAARLFSAWHEFQQDGDRARLLAQTEPLRAELKQLLERHAGKSPKYKRSRGLARNLLNFWPALSTFTEIDGVEPTNNRAERGLRGVVIYRKLSLGSQSERGEQTIERSALSLAHVRTLARSAKSERCWRRQANARGDPIPSLV
jgi:transposase